MTFLAGRACARAALTRLGREGGPLAPCRAVGVHWPVGVVGSITHTSGYAAAAVMAAADGHIGIDAEHVGRIAPSLWPAFLTQAEQAELDRAPPAVRQVRAAIAFSAKEAVYKAFRAGGGPRLGFSDVEIAISADGFAPRFRGVDGPPGHGRFQRHGDLILSAVVLGRL